MTRLEIARRRLCNQRIAEARLERPAEIVGWLGAVQAQDYAGAKWALGLRLQGASDGDIDRAFADGAILRTHLMRPTWHFVTPADIGWMLALTAPRVHIANAHMYRKLELDTAIFRRCNAAIAKALRGKQLTRDELRDILQKAGVAADNGLRMAYILMRAELDGLICSGARKGKQFTYALLDERAPQARVLEHEEALEELAGRYFMSRGPATLQDFAKWSGLTIREARSGLEAVRAKLQVETMDGHDYWYWPASATKEVSPVAYLLSIYDEYISGYKDRSAIAEAEVGTRLSAMGNALSYIIVLDGQIVGTWRRQLGKDAVTIELNLFTRLRRAETHAIAAAAHRYGRFLGLPVVLNMDTSE